MGFKVITAAVSPVIPLVDLRAHLRLDLLGGVTHPDDALIEGYLAAARGYCEHYTQRSIGVQTLEVAMDAFPESAIELPLGAASIVSVTYVDAALVVQTVSNTTYLLDNYSHQSWVMTTATWPAVGDFANAVKVRYVTADGIEATVKSAMLLLVGHWYENRESSNFDKLQNIPLGVQALLDTQRVYN